MHYPRVTDLIRHAFGRMRGHSKERLAYVLSLALGLGAVLSIGPELQTYSAALITSQEASIYSTAYKSDLILYPHLSDWMLAAWSPIYSLMALTIVAAVARCSDVRSTFVIGSLATFLILTSTDAVWQLTNGGSFNQFIVCIIANLFGSPVVSGALLLLVSANDIIHSFLVAHPHLQKVTKFGLPIAAGLLFQLASYYLITLFYSPTTTAVDAILSPPISGYYSTAELKWRPPADVVASTDNKKQPENFGIFARQANLFGTLTWVGQSKPLIVSWNRSGDQKYDVPISAYDGCKEGARNLKKHRKGPAVFFQDVKQLNLRLDQGMADLEIGDGSKNAGYF